MNCSLSSVITMASLNNSMLMKPAIYRRRVVICGLYRSILFYRTTRSFHISLNVLGENSNSLRWAVQALKSLLTIQFFSRPLPAFMSLRLRLDFFHNFQASFSDQVE